MSRLLVPAVVGVTVALLSSCQEAPPAYPSALVTIDTDLPVPAVISRLQVDVFSGEGKWIEQRQFTFTRPEEWPASFGVFLPDDSRSVDVMLRVRGFVSERDYLGERFLPHEPYVPPPVATSLTSLCEKAPVLVHREVLVQRAGGTPLFAKTCGDSGQLTLDNATGSVAAYVDVPTKGRYRFEVVASLLQSMTTYAFGTSLHLAKNCLEPVQTTLACNHDIATDEGRFGHLEMDLDPGRYTLITASSIGGSVGNVALRWAEVSQWGEAELPPALPPSVNSKGVELRLDHKDGEVDKTPATEPSPDSTVDRLVRLHLEPGKPQKPLITLSGACAGTMAKLTVRNNRVDPTTSETCIGDDGVAKLVRVPFGATAFDGAGSSSSSTPRAGTFATDPCADEDSDDNTVCVPGGAFVFGDPNELAMADAPLGAPVRIAAVKRFFIDRYEMTVGRYRKALAAGLHIDTPYLPEADRPTATFTYSASGKEDLPLNSIVWEAARKVCQHSGGDLPTEAQWERAATFDPDRRKRRFPWGDDEPDCKRTVYGRKDPARQCAAVTLPFGVRSAELAGDVSFLGIVGLAGNVSEWVLGSPRVYDDACWRGTTAIDPVCFDPADASRAARGAGFGSHSSFLSLTRRGAMSTAYGRATIGFRCAYAESRR